MTAPVLMPRWLLYRLVDVSDTGYRSVLGTWVHPAIAGIPVPAVLDSSWLASGEGLHGTRPGVYGLVQDLFDRGAPPVVEVLSDHGAWGEEAVELGQRLVEEVTWDEEPFGGAVFRGRPGFTYSGETLDRVVFARPCALPHDRDTFFVTVGRLPGGVSVEAVLRSDPDDALSMLRGGLGPNVAAALRYRSGDYPAFLVVVAGTGLADGMIPRGMVLGVWEARTPAGSGGGEGDEASRLETVDALWVRAVRASLVGTVVPVKASAGWHLPGVGVDDPRGGPQGGWSACAGAGSTDPLEPGPSPCHGAGRSRGA